jgi:hypothetical protein
MLETPFELLQTRTSIKLSPDELYYIAFNLAASEMFVLAHELAHVYAGHLENSAIRSIAHDQVDLLRKRPLECYQLSWQQEIEADRLGFFHFLKAWPQCELRFNKSELNPVDIIAPFSFFELLQLVESNISIPDAYMTHPPAIQRSGAIMDVLAALYDLKNPRNTMDTEVRDMCISFMGKMKGLQQFKVNG